MDWLIWTGAAVSLAGIAGLIWVVIYTIRARRAGLDDDALRARLQRAVAMNLGALAVSAIGLIVVVLGVILA